MHAPRGARATSSCRACAASSLDLVVAIDTCGSIKDAEMQEFIDEIDALKGQVRARVTLLPCDVGLCEGAPFRFEPWEQFARPREINGGGGTSFTPGLRVGRRAGLQPDLLVYFTDADGRLPQVGAPLSGHLVGQGPAPRCPGVSASSSTDARGMPDAERAVIVAPGSGVRSFSFGRAAQDLPGRSGDPPAVAAWALEGSRRVPRTPIAPTGYSHRGLSCSWALEDSFTAVRPTLHLTLQARPRGVALQ